MNKQKSIFFIAILLIMLSLSVFAADIDPLIEEKLKENNHVSVIVEMNDHAFKDNINSGKKSLYGSVTDTLGSNLKIKRKYNSFNGFAGNITKEGLETLKNNPNIEAVYYDKLYYTTLLESRPIVNSTIAVQRLINNNNLTGKGFSVCVADTGINYTHADFGGCSTNEFTSGDCAKVLGGYDFVNDDNDPYDLQGHGTHVSGIIAANGEILGTAPEATIVSVKVCNDDSSATCQWSDILGGLLFCLDHKDDYNITAISMSLGTTAVYSTYCDSTSQVTKMINNATGQNITVVVASGNGASLTGISDPACVQNSTAIGATYDFVGTYIGSCVDDNTSVNNIACFSNINGITDLLAPGAEIYSTYSNGKYATLSGTSMSTPIVSGSVAILQQYKKLESNSTLTPAVVVEALRAGGKNITSGSWTIPRADIVGALIRIDTKVPEVIIATLSNGSVYNSTNLDYNFTAVDTNIDSCFYSLNGAVNISLSSCANTTFSFTNLNNTILFYVNDSAENINTTQIIFDIDVVLSSLDSPVNFFNTSSNTLIVNCTSQVIPSKNLINSTLYHNITGIFSANITINSSNYINSSSFTISDIPDGTYSWNCLAFGNNTNVLSAFGSSNFTFTVDTLKPIFSSISSSADSSSATITWSSNELSNSTVYYGTTIATSSFSDNSGFVTSHSLSLSSLSSSTLYYFNVSGCDNIGNCTSSSTFNFTTSASASPTGGSSGGGGGGGGGGGSIQSGNSKEEIFPTLDAFRDNVIKANKKDLALTLVGIVPNKDIANVKVSLNDFGNKKPSEIKWLPQSVYKYLSINISSAEDKDLNRVLIRFKVAKSWLTSNGLGKERITLLRWHENKWNNLNTIFYKEINDGEYFEFESLSPGLSFFAITLTPIADTIPVTVKNDTIPNLFNDTDYVSEEKEIIIDEDISKKSNMLRIIVLSFAILIFIFVVYKITSDISKVSKKRIKK